MKAPTKGNHPCPVLLDEENDYGDYKESCSIDASLKVESKGRSTGDNQKIDLSWTMEFCITIDLNCPPLQTLIDNGKAKIIYIIDQATTRKVYDYPEHTKFELKPYFLQLGKQVEVTPAVVATQDTQLPYDGQYMDDIFGGFGKESFPVEKGQFLAYGKPLTIFTDQHKALSQIITIDAQKLRPSQMPFTVNFDDEKIHVHITQKLKDDIRRMQLSFGTADGLINSAIAYPVLLMAIENLIYHADDYSNYQWAIAIKNRLSDLPEVGGDFDRFVYDARNNDSNEYNPTAWHLTCMLLADDQMDLLGKSISDYLNRNSSADSKEE